MAGFIAVVTFLAGGIAPGNDGAIDSKKPVAAVLVQIQSDVSEARRLRRLLAQERRRDRFVRPNIPGEPRQINPNLIPGQTDGLGRQVPSLSLPPVDNAAGAGSIYNRQ